MSAVVRELRPAVHSTTAAVPEADASVLIASAATMLRRGRPAAALLTLEAAAERLPDELVAAAQAGWHRGFVEGRATGWRDGFDDGVRAAATPARGVADVARLARLCAEPDGRALVLRLLKIGERDLDAILAGRVGLSAVQWKRLRNFAAERKAS